MRPKVAFVPAPGKIAVPARYLPSPADGGLLPARQSARDLSSVLHACSRTSRMAARAWRIPQEVYLSVARVVEISATSEQSFEDALQQGVARATQTPRNVRSAWVK